MWQIIVIALSCFVTDMYCADQIFPDSLAGVWQNELDSEVLFVPATAGSPVNSFSGLYMTKVGSAAGWYPLVGLYDPDGDATEGTLGWTVQWDNDKFGNSHSTTTWSGQRFLNPDDSSDKIIETTWLLTSQKSYSEKWGSTQVGQDTFRKISDDTDLSAFKNRFKKSKAEL